MANEFLQVAHAVQAEIDITPNGASRTWAVFGNGIENLGEALNETVQQYFFFSNHGFASNFVTGMAPAYTCTGRRILGDPAQDYIFNPARKFGLMVERNTNFRMSIGQADGTISQITCGVTIGNMTDIGGATTDGTPISFEVRVNGKPELATVTPPTTLTVTSEAGTASGSHKISVVPANPMPGTKYVCNYGNPAPTAEVGDVLTGWNDFNAGADYVVPVGDTFVVAAISTSTNKVAAVGQVVIS